MVEMHKFDKGVMWDENPWTIEEDHRSLFKNKEDACPHCKEIKLMDYKEDGYTWICPRVIKVKNMDGNNSTGLCLDCVLDGAKERGLI